jgi:hypothetical protein
LAEDEEDCWPACPLIEELELAPCWSCEPAEDDCCPEELPIAPWDCWDEEEDDGLAEEDEEGLADDCDAPLAAPLVSDEDELPCASENVEIDRRAAARAVYWNFMVRFLSVATGSDGTGNASPWGGRSRACREQTSLLRSCRKKRRACGDRARESVFSRRRSGKRFAKILPAASPQIRCRAIASACGIPRRGKATIQDRERPRPRAALSAHARGEPPWRNARS